MIPYLFLIPSFIFFILFSVWPIIEVLRLSFYQTNFITSTFVGLQNYIDSFQNEMFLSAMRNSFWYVILMVSGITFSSLFIALTVSNLSKKWQDTSRILIYVPVLSGGIIIAQVWKWVFSTEGVANWLLGLFGIDPVFWFSQGSTAIPVVVFVVVMASIGTYMIIFLASILSIDKGIFEAARIDGASKSQIKWMITIPILTPTIILVSLLAMIASLQVIETVMALVPQTYAFTPAFSIYTLGFKFSKWGMASAQSIILLVITVMLSILKKRIEETK